MSNRICPQCGFEDLDDEDMFCVECGYNLNLIKHAQQTIPESNVPQTSTELHLSKDMIELYKQDEAKLSELENLDADLRNHQQYFNQVSKDLNELKSKVYELKEITRKEHKDVEKLNKLSWTSIKARMKGDKEAQLEREEYEYLEALNQEQNAIHQLELIQRKYNSANSQLTQLQNLAKYRNSLTVEIRNIVDKACEGVPDPIEDQIEIKLAEVQKQKHPILQKKKQIEQATGHYRNAHHYLNRALNLLGDAGGLADWDTFFGGGFLADSMKHSKLSETQREVQSAVFELNTALKILPNGPRISIPDIWRGSGVWDMMFDGFFADMHVRNRIRESTDRTRQSFHQLNKALTSLQRQIQGLTNQLKELDQKIRSIREELTKERIRMFENAIA